MPNLQQILQAFKALNFEDLEELLNDNYSYMDVPKDVFLKRLQEEIKKYQDKGLRAYDKVSCGTCGNCYKGCDAYSFSKEGFPFLNLYFELDKGEVKDIHLCHKLEGLEQNVNENDIYMKFHEEEKVGFKPSLKYLLDKQRADKAVEDFKRIASNKIIPVEDLAYWRDKYKDIAGPFGYNSPLDYYTYSAFFEFDSISSSVYNFAQAYDANAECTKALEHYYSIVNLDERELVKWLVMYKENNIYFNFNGTDNWQNTQIVKFSKDSDLLVDCLACINALKYDEIYSKEEHKLLEKYQPTSAHFKANNNSIEYSLKSYLRVHGKYLDIIDDSHDF
jgi:hypothetical protein